MLCGPPFVAGESPTVYLVSSKSDDFAISPSDHNGVFVVDASSAPVTVTLPPATGLNGFRFHIKKIDVTANAVTVDADGSETIDGSLTVVISGQNDSIPVNGDGTNWIIL